MTTYTSQSHVAVGDPITAAGENTLRDNVKAVWENGATGKLLYYPTASTIGGLALPSTYPGILQETTAGVLSWMESSAPFQVLRSNASQVPQWSSQGHMTRAERGSDLTPFTRSNLISWDASTTLDDDSLHNPASNPSRVTVAADGWYTAVLFLKMTIGGADWAMDAQLRLNGTPFGGNAGWGGNGGGATRYFGCSGIVLATTGQYIEAFLDWNGTGTTCTIYTNSYLFVQRLR
jgi:hypothetical protein